MGATLWAEREVQTRLYNGQWVLSSPRLRGLTCETARRLSDIPCCSTVRLHSPYTV